MYSAAGGASTAGTPTYPPRSQTPSTSYSTCFPEHMTLLLQEVMKINGVKRGVTQQQVLMMVGEKFKRCIHIKLVDTKIIKYYLLWW